MPSSYLDTQRGFQQLPGRATSSLPNMRKGTSETDVRQVHSLSMSQIRKHDSFDCRFKPTPYHIRWVYGYNNKAGVININKHGSSTVFYAASNFGILYNWVTNDMRILQGHRHMLTCIATDAEARWLVTGGSGPENVIIIWDSKDVFPQRIIFSPHKNVRLGKLALSADAKFLVTVAYTRGIAEIFWWIWSFGLNGPHAKIDIPITKDSVIDVQFNPVNSFEFVLITKNELWIVVSEKIFVMERGLFKETDDYQLKSRCPERKPKVEHGRLTCFAFVSTSSRILVGTSRGYVLVYGYTMEYQTNVDASNYENLRYVKALKVENHKINVIKWVDEAVVTGNSAGQIHFYNDQVKLMYWVRGFTVDAVKGLSFNVFPRSYIILDPQCNSKCACWEKVVAVTDPNTGEVTTKLMKKKVPFDCSKGGMPFLVRDFVVCTHDQGIGFVDFVPEKCKIILDYRISPALALSVHPDKSLFCVGYLDGNVELIRYTDKHRIHAHINLRDAFTIVQPPSEDAIKGDYTNTVPQLSVTCLKYSPSGFHLACGLNTGQLLFLDPTTIDLKEKQPHHDTSFAIKEINYSPDSLSLVFVDVGKTVGVYKYYCYDLQWRFVGKYRAHYKDISTAFFLTAKNPDGEFKLLSFGMDRLMVEYDVGKSGGDQLVLISVDRVDQTAIPLSGIVWPPPKDLDPKEQHTHVPTVLVANDEHKYKILNYETTMTLATYLGPRFEHPVRHMMLITSEDPDLGMKNEYLLFATKIVIGIQKMPLDGNPWKHIGMLGHPNQIIKMCFREDSGTLFTIGARDSCVTQWTANFKSVDKTTKLGGGDLDPYYCLVENGRPGWLFQEVRDLFYYIQILCQGTFSPAMRKVKDYIPIGSLPDMMRALGYFPSEYEVENLLVEAKYKVYNRKQAAEIDFEEFVKLYLNHRPAFLESTKKIKDTFKAFASNTKKDGDFIHRDDLVDILAEYGEKFSRELSWYLLSILSGQSFEDRANSSNDDFSFLPVKIKLNELLTTVMGIPETYTVSEQQSTSSIAQDDSSSVGSYEGLDKLFS